jgi:hypothetical protein
MATSVGLNFRLTAAVENFEKSMADVNRKLGQIDKSSRSTASGMKLLAGIEVGKLLVGGLTKVAGLASSAASSIIGFANSARDTADKIGKLASQTGMAVEPLQVLQQIAEYSGLSLDSFRSAAQKMSRSLGDASNGVGTAGASLKRMGLDLNELLKMSPSQQFMVIGEAIASIEDPAKRSAEAAAIFGRNGMTMIPMFKDLTKVAKETGDEMLSLGQVLSTDQVRNIEAMNDSFVTVQQTAKKIGTQVLANFAPALTAANDALMEMVKNFEYEGATGGQGVAKLLTDGLFAGARSMAEALDAFLGGFDTTTSVMQTALAKLITAFEIVSAPFIGGDAAARLGAFAQQLEGAAQRTKSVDVSFVDLVDKAKALYDNASSAADGLAGMNKETQSVPSKMQLLAAAAEKAAPVVGNFEKAIPGAISKVMDFGKGLLDSGTNFVGKLVERANVADTLYDKFQGLVDAGLGTSAELRQLTAVASGTGAAADAAKARLNMLAGSAEMLSSTQERLANKMMSPIERWADQRQNFLEAMGFNPFYVEEQKRLWLAKQKEAVDAQIEEAKKAYLGFKETLGESLGIIGEDGSLEIPEPIDPREAINATTEAVGEVVTELKNVWSNVMVGLIG